MEKLRDIRSLSETFLPISNQTARKRGRIDYMRGNIRRYKSFELSRADQRCSPIDLRSLIDQRKTKKNPTQTHRKTAKLHNQRNKKLEMGKR